MNKLLMVTLGLISTLSSAKDARRLITIGGNVSETACALGYCENIVATDSSSLYPNSLTKLPQVGYARSLNAEGLIAQKADLVLATASAGPDSVIEKVKVTGIKFQAVDGGITVDAAKARITALGDILDKKAEAKNLLQDLDKDLQALQMRRMEIKTPLKVMFIYARGAKVLQVSGDHTAAASMIELAGGKNAFTGFNEYKGLTPEAAVAAAPDVILMTKDGIAGVGGLEAVWKLPGLAMTPAFQKKRLVVMEDLFLLGMGPRLGKAALQLMDELYLARK
ncbi:MAG TPA: ABC transporter substrate-binding protein [Oligoflexus sp.]|uniref:heme/hemin ABC transporter substrate-binding protein n=1 Tax=Oligoflexus sp. TaxID=1971216 RepID=UPI002D3638A1|nr:ABC transporter substrate-binding protein [Oligoflexus sp.]HYX35483.1 ABC transporter substrate-binding protein [Oligoflexus sp.]